MWEPKSCCCGCSVRTGTLVIGWLLLIGSGLNVLSNLRYAAYSHADFEQMCEMIVNNTDGLQYINPDYCPAIASGVLAYVASSGVLCGVGLIISILLVVGINKNKYQLMVPYLVMRVIEIAIMILMGLSLVIYMLYLGTFLGAFIVGLAAGLATFLNTYFFLVTRACYKEVKALSGDGEVPYAQQHDMSFKA